MTYNSCNIYNNSDCFTPFNTFFGLSTKLLPTIHSQGICSSSGHFAFKELSEIRRALLTLERGGLAYNIKRKPRWFPATHAITICSFAAGSQTSLGGGCDG